MKKIYRNVLKGGLACAMIALGTTACTDDHFDIQQGTPTTGQTLWQNVEANPELKSFAEILKRTTVLRNDYDKSASMKYSDFLSGSQYLTVWAPKDGTYQPQVWLDSLDKVAEIKSMAEVAGNNRDSLLKEALKLEYKVGVQFVQNHMARFNYEANPNEQEVRMLNAKKCNYNAAAGTFNSVPLSPENELMVSSNGVMHLLDGISPFAYNLYDIMGAYPEYSNIYNYLSSKDVKTFSPGLSTEGAMDNNGQMQYVDSFYTTTNSVLSAARASVRDEDSLYIALLPTNKGWDEALKKLESLYNYGGTYKTKWSKSEFTEEKKLNADSLRDLNTKSALIQSMYISASSFASLPEASRKDSAQLINYALMADSLKSTNDVVYYNQGKTEYNGNNDVVNPAFAGIVPQKASNGYVLPMDDYTIDPAYAWQTRRVYSPLHVYSGTTKTQYIYLTADVKNDTILGELPDNGYMRYEVEQNKAFDVDIALRNVLSGKYRIKVYLLPSAAYKGYADSVTVGKNKYKEKIVLTPGLLYDGDTKVTVKAKDITVSDSEILAYTLINSNGNDYFEFTKCYEGLPSDYESFPRLRFSLARPSKNSPANAFNLGQIILEPVRE